MPSVLTRAQAGELWIADRNFSTRASLSGWHARGCHFIVREHAHMPHPKESEAARYQGRIETGRVYEQAVSIEDETGPPLALRRVEIQLHAPTEDGDTLIRVLTNAPKAHFTARKMARLYRQLWRIETLFQRLESVLHSEVTSLGHPRAALLELGVAVLTYNVLAVLQAAVCQAHRLRDSGVELFSYYLADEIRTHYAGMMMAVAATAWVRYETLTATQLAQTLLEMAQRANPKKLRKHPRGPNTPKKKGNVCGAIARRHVSTARAEGRGIN